MVVQHISHPACKMRITPKPMFQVFCTRAATAFDGYTNLLYAHKLNCFCREIVKGTERCHMTTTHGSRPCKMPYRNAIHACKRNLEAHTGVTATGNRFGDPASRSPVAALETCNCRLMTNKTPMHCTVAVQLCRNGRKSTWDVKRRYTIVEGGE